MTTTTRIIAHSVPVRNNPPYLAKPLTPAQIRNRRLLCAALSANIRIIASSGERSVIQSTGACYSLRVWEDADGTRKEQCACQWGRAHGQVETYLRGTEQMSTNGVLPCKHILTHRFYALAPLDRALLLIEDAELRRAFLRGSRGADGPAPTAAAVARHALQEVAA